MGKGKIGMGRDRERGRREKKGRWGREG